MKIKFAVTFCFLGSMYFTQKIKVLDAETQKPVPYAKLILKSQNYKNTEENGEIFLENNEEISEIQSLGNENLKTDQPREIYFLKPKYIEIDEVEIARPKFAEIFTLGKVKKSKTYYGAHGTSWLVGKELKNNYAEPVFIKSVKFSSRLLDKSYATIKMNFYYNKNGIPGDLHKSFIVTCLKSKRTTEYNISKPFLFPKEGLIIGFEWILNNENSYKKVMLLNNQEKETIAHEPLIGSVQEDKKNVIIGNLQDNSWIYINTSENERKSHGNLSIEIELTN
jgi:hypothetical protein